MLTIDKLTREVMNHHNRNHHNQQSQRLMSLNYFEGQRPESQAPTMVCAIACEDLLRIRELTLKLRSGEINKAEYESMHTEILRQVGTNTSPHTPSPSPSLSSDPLSSPSSSSPAP